MEFRPMRRSKQELSREECIEILMQEPRGVLSVLGEGGYPYGMPINQYYCPENGRLYFHTGWMPSGPTTRFPCVYTTRVTGRKGNGP